MSELVWLSGYAPMIRGLLGFRYRTMNSSAVSALATSCSSRNLNLRTWSLKIDTGSPSAARGGPAGFCARADGTTIAETSNKASVAAHRMTSISRQTAGPCRRGRAESPCRPAPRRTRIVTPRGPASNDSRLPEG